MRSNRAFQAYGCSLNREALFLLPFTIMSLTDLCFLLFVSENSQLRISGFFRPSDLGLRISHDAS
jgi:hypothetical protein